ncbi:hypothetical protein NLG97_g6277 [Lecanicillium saksenae]|uniref:Uncharacterized protein n=1 Tax=Lecanicillium saksenae TaxID=468837 RepID=A0ACC1QTW6_9HYPO|nr:hypothetical protein NLG97_g6277 [Lecanicillium saksenae]
MNWSNGQLARQSRRRYNTDATKRKQYFAQAKRQKAPESQNQRYSSANFVPSYLKDAPEDLNRTPRDGTGHREPRRRIVTLQAVPDTAQDVPKPSEYESAPSKTKRPNGTLEVTGTNIDAKRRKLLEQSDWSGVELQKPVVIEYPKTTGLTRRFHRIVPDQSMSPIVKASKNDISANTVIKIANQKYRWSPGNNSIRTCHSTRRSTLPETPLSTEKQVYNTSSSASKSFSSFVQESPCAGRALQVGRSRVNKTQLQSVSHTSPSVYDEPLVKAGAEVQYFHPQPIRHVPQSVYTRLVNSAHNDDIEFRLGRVSPLFPQSNGPSYLPAIENQSGESIALEQFSNNPTAVAPINRRRT